MSAPHALPGPDGVTRCHWAVASELDTAYHDAEWGVPVSGESAHLERLTLEGFQAGLSWITILRKRERFREVFAGFEADVVAGFGPDRVEELLADPGIVRHRGKIEAAVRNAAATVALRADGGLESLIASYAPQRPVGYTETASAESTALSRELKRRGFTFVGPTTMHALMQALGAFDPHAEGCHRRGTRVA